MVVLCAPAVACQKENPVDTDIYAVASENCRTVCYIVDGAAYSTTIHDDTAWADLLRNMAALAKEGHNVTLWKISATTHGEKKTVTYTTDNEDDAIKWAAKMTDEGYVVHISYDSKTGIWTCIAVK